VFTLRSFLLPFPRFLPPFKSTTYEWKVWWNVYTWTLCCEFHGGRITFSFLHWGYISKSRKPLAANYSVSNRFHICKSKPGIGEQNLQLGITNWRKWVCVFLPADHWTWESWKLSQSGVRRKRESKSSEMYAAVSCNFSIIILIHLSRFILLAGIRPNAVFRNPFCRIKIFRLSSMTRLYVPQ
jgi:hypothetical protein